MAGQHRATDKQWRDVKARASDNVAYSTILELRDRIEALEAAQPAKSNHPAKPDSSLVERVAFAIVGDSDGPIDWKPEARAAIREVADWMRKESEGHLGSGLYWAKRLEQEAKR